MISVFTPSHDPSGLGDLYKSLREQTYQSWEWVIVPNGEGSQAVIDKVTGYDDDRIKVYPVMFGGIGALKKYACSRCTGDVFVEVDHDDMILPECLAAIAAVARGRAFIYSDAITLEADGRSQVYRQDCGWEQYRHGEHWVNRTPPATAHSLSSVLFAPDHVRAWTREAYVGHDERLEVGDDHELIVRTYLAGAEFVHIQRPLYVHRLSQSSASVKRCQDIAAISQRTSDTHFHALVAEECRRRQLPKFDLGGAHDCPAGYTPVDKVLGTDVFDLDVPDGSVGCFRAFDFLEHVADKIRLMNFLWRKLAPGGYVLTHTPSSEGRGAHQDPTHVSYWNANSFWYFSRQEWAKYVPEIECRFATTRVGTWYPSEFHKQHCIPYVIWDGHKPNGYCPRVAWPY